MITRIGALTLSALLSVSVFACEKTGEKEQSAEGRANKQADEAQNEAARKAAAAQAEADQKIAAARADFEKAREDYRHSRQADLDDLNRKIADLEARDRTATGKTKTDLDAALPVIRAQRDAFTRDMKSLESATPASWDGFKSRLDGEWDALKANVDKVS
jgi:septal ring factor EnvC (AmiA/AmiB activator)